jgi:hypothetical protein
LDSLVVQVDAQGASVGTAANASRWTGRMHATAAGQVRQPDRLRVALLLRPVATTSPVRDAEVVADGRSRAEYGGAARARNAPLATP